MRPFVDSPREDSVMPRVLVAAIMTSPATEARATIASGVLA